MSEKKKKLPGSFFWALLFALLCFLNAFGLAYREVGVGIRFLDPKISAVIYVVLGIAILVVWFIWSKGKKKAASSEKEDESE